jgi:Universal stress protein family
LLCAPRPLVLRGAAGPELVSLASQPGDLLVIGGGRRTALTRLVCCPVARHCLAHAHCPVLAVPPPDLAQHAGHGLRGWAFRHRGLDPGQASPPSQTPGPGAHGSPLFPQSRAHPGPPRPPGREEAG